MSMAIKDKERELVVTSSDARLTQFRNSLWGARLNMGMGQLLEAPPLIMQASECVES